MQERLRLISFIPSVFLPPQHFQQVMAGEGGADRWGRGRWATTKPQRSNDSSHRSGCEGVT